VEAPFDLAPCRRLTPPVPCPSRSVRSGSRRRQHRGAKRSQSALSRGRLVLTGARRSTDGRTSQRRSSPSQPDRYRAASFGAALSAGPSGRDPFFTLGLQPPTVFVVSWRLAGNCPDTPDARVSPETVPCARRPHGIGGGALVNAQPALDAPLCP